MSEINSAEQQEAPPVAEPAAEADAAPAAVPEAGTVAVTESAAVPEAGPEPVSEAAAVPATEAVPEPEPGVEPRVEVEIEPEPEPGTEAGPVLVTETDAVPPAAPKAPRRKVRALLRWTAAVLVFAVVGGASAYAVTRPERTDVPGLRTPDDGRWSYAPLALPKLPAGKPRPLDGFSNPGAHHYADIRSLLLPAPEGATAEPGLPGKSGWLSDDDFLKAYDISSGSAAAEKLALKDEGLRHIAAEGWTMPDGTRSEVYLLQFISAGYLVEEANAVESETVKGVAKSDVDQSVASAEIPPAITVYAYGESGADTGGTRYAYLQAGDTVAFVVQSRPGGTAEVPFRQTVRLQGQLLG